MNAPGGMNSAYFFCREQPIQVNFVQAGGKPFLAQMGGLAQREVQEQEKTLQDRALRIAFLRTHRIRGGFPCLSSCPA